MAQFEDLAIPFTAVATDIDSGNPVLIQEGPICCGIEASATVPLAYHPVKVGGRYLVDGGVVDLVPIDAAMALSADRVIAVDVSTMPDDEPHSSPGLLFRLDLIARRQLTRTQEELARARLGEGRLVTLRPDIRRINWAAFDSIDDCIRSGEEEALRRLDEIKRVVQLA